MWIANVVRTAGRFGHEGLSYTPTRAVASFFVPFLNLVHGYQVVSEVWRASEPSDAGSSRSWMLNETPGFILAWWLTYLGARGAFLASWGRESFSVVLFAFRIVLDVASALLVVRVIGAIDARQRAFAERLEVHEAAADAVRPRKKKKEKSPPSD